MLAPSMMGSRIGRDSTLACGTAPCPSRRSSALPFVTTPDNRLRYKRDNSRLCTEGRCRHLVHPALELGSAIGFTKETIIPQKPPPHDNAEALAGRCVLHPP